MVNCAMSYIVIGQVLAVSSAAGCGLMIIIARLYIACISVHLVVV